MGMTVLQGERFIRIRQWWKILPGEREGSFLLNIM
jgi:hypothetical protein